MNCSRAIDGGDDSGHGVFRPTRRARRTRARVDERDGIRSPPADVVPTMRVRHEKVLRARIPSRAAVRWAAVGDLTRCDRLRGGKIFGEAGRRDSRGGNERFTCRGFERADPHDRTFHRIPRRAGPRGFARTTSPLAHGRADAATLGARHPQFDRDRLAAGPRRPWRRVRSSARARRLEEGETRLRSTWVCGIRASAGFADHMQTADFEAGLRR